MVAVEPLPSFRLDVRMQQVLLEDNNKNLFETHQLLHADSSARTSIAVPQQLKGTRSARSPLLAVVCGLIVQRSRSHHATVDHQSLTAGETEPLVHQQVRR